ncbi:MAG TPA: hypothetical protein VGH28_30610 [Polyangiaceae bacterium]
MAFRSFAHWSEPLARASRVVTRLRCIGALDSTDVAEIRGMKHLRDLVLEGIETFPLGLCDLAELRSLTINKRGEPGVTDLPDALCGLVSLRTLRIRATRLRALPDAIVDMPALVELDVRHSGVHRLPPKLLELRNLRRIAVGE